MSRTTFEEALARVDSVFRLVIVASKRAKQLDNGSLPLLKTESRKSTLIALEEVAEGKVGYQVIEEKEEGLLQN